MSPRIAQTMGMALALATATVPAWAQDDDASRAEGLFREGLDLESRGERGEACRLYAASNALREAGATLMYLAGCHERAGEVVEAFATYQQVRDLAEASGRTDKVAEIDDKLAELAAQIGDAAPEQAAPPPVAAQPAVEPLVLSPPVALPTPAPAPAPPPPDDGPSAWRITSYAGFGVAGLGALTFAVAGGVASSAHATITDDCPDTSVPCTQHEDTIAKRDATSIVAITGAAVAGLGLTVGLVSLSVDSEGQEPVTLTPTIGLGELGITGTF